MLKEIRDLLKCVEYVGGVCGEMGRAGGCEIMRGFKTLVSIFLGKTKKVCIFAS